MDARLTGIVHDDGELVAWLAAGNLRGADAISCWDAKLTDTAARALADSPDAAQLASVDLSWNRIGAPGAAALASRVKALTKLRLYHNDVGEAGARAIAEHGARLESLNLCGNQLGDPGFAALAAGDLRALHELALGWNQLGGDAARAVAAGPWRGLTRLNIRANHLDAAAVTALLATDLPITWLGIDENPLGAAGVAAIVDAPGFARFEVLNLGGCELDDAALGPLARGATTALREVRLQDNRLSAPALAELRAALPACEVRT